MNENCSICKQKQKECIVCNKKICILCDNYSKYNKYNLFCVDCSKYQCKLCNGRLDRCIKCKKDFCIVCDDGECVTEWDTDIYYCKQHRALRIEELHKYMIDMYNEKLSLEELRKKILNIE